MITKTLCWQASFKSWADVAHEPKHEACRYNVAEELTLQHQNIRESCVLPIDCTGTCGSLSIRTLSDQAASKSALEMTYPALHVWKALWVPIKQVAQLCGHLCMYIRFETSRKLSNAAQTSAKVGAQLLPS